MRDNSYMENLLGKTSLQSPSPVDDIALLIEGHYNVATFIQNDLNQK